jgi:hypothetical protein
MGLTVPLLYRQQILRAMPCSKYFESWRWRAGLRAPASCELRLLGRVRNMGNRMCQRSPLGLPGPARLRRINERRA